MKRVNFPRWAEVLVGCELEDSVKARYKKVIAVYLSWCGKQGCFCTRDSAERYLAYVEERWKPSEDDTAVVKSGLRWFFRTAAQGGLMPRVPSKQPAGRSFAGYAQSADSEKEAYFKRELSGREKGDRYDGAAAGIVLPNRGELFAMVSAYMPVPRGRGF